MVWDFFLESIELPSNYVEMRELAYLFGALIFKYFNNLIDDLDLISAEEVRYPGRS